MVAILTLILIGWLPHSVIVTLRCANRSDIVWIGPGLLESSQRFVGVIADLPKSLAACCIKPEGSKRSPGEPKKDTREPNKNTRGHLCSISPQDHRAPVDHTIGDH